MTDNDDVTHRLEDAKRDYAELGGWQAFKNGEWLHLLIRRSFRSYWERGTADYFLRKYPGCDAETIAKKLIAVAAKNASVLGGVTAAAVSTDEIVGFLTAGGAVIGLPATVAIASASLAGEAVLLVRVQLQLIANLGRIYGVPLDPNDPEDVLTILAFALGGSAAEAAGKAGMKVGGQAAGLAAKAMFAGDTLALAKKIGAKVGVKILQRSIVKYTVPVASIGIGAGWNYMATRTVGRLATRHFQQRLVDIETGLRNPP